MAIHLAGTDKDGHAFRLEAARLFGPPPIDDLHLPLSPGVTAFYGMNGAGKSRILRGLGSLLNGEVGWNGYLVASSDLRSLTAATCDGFEMALLTIADSLDLVPSSDDMWYLDEDEPEPILTIEVADVVEAMLSAALVEQVRAEGDKSLEWVAAVAASVAQQGTWILRSIVDGASWDVSPAFLVTDDDVELRNRLSSCPTEATAQIDWAQALVDDFPILRTGPLSYALGTGDRFLIDRGIRDLRRATARPIELIERSFDTRSPMPELELVDVLDNRLRSVDDLTEQTVSLLSSSGKESERPVLDEAAATELSAIASAIANRALPNGLTVSCVILEAPEGGDSSIVWQAGTKSRTDLGLDDLSDAQHRWAVRAIVLALRQVERSVAHAARSTERFEAEAAQLRERRENVGRERRRHEESKREKDLYREAHEEHLHEHAAQVDWKTSQGLEPDVFEADYDVDDLFEDETETNRAARRIQEKLVSIAEIDPHQRAANHLRRFPQSPLVLLMDEPEAGLHRTAERDIVRLLIDVADEQQTTTFVATHSPEFLRNRHVRAFVTKRDERDNTVIDDSWEILGDTAGDYGLSRLDVLHLSETILLVEGRHDEIVLERLIGDQLRHLRVLVVPLHGGRLMPDAADARILQDFTDQRIVALVDNLDPTRFDDLLAAARNIAPGDLDEFDAVADRVLDGRKDSDEVGFIRRLLRRAFEHGRLERFRVHGLSAPDILEYLPSDPFGLDRSWAELRIEFDKQTKIKRFKRWLELKKGASFADDDVVAACARMDDLPEDLTGLLAVLAAGDERT